MPRLPTHDATRGRDRVATRRVATSKSVRHFYDRLAELETRGPRRWLYVPYDQLSDAIGPLARENPGELGIVMIESPWKAARRPYHQQKLATVLTNGRHFALEQAARGVAVEMLVARERYAEVLGPFARRVGGVRMMEAAERELRHDIQPLVDDGLVEVSPHEGWLTTRAQFRAATGKPPWRMDAFYRLARRTSGVLMTHDGKPLGGKLSFDRDNREAWRGEPPVPVTPTYAVDAITTEVVELIRKHFAGHPGDLRPELIPATREDAAALWEHAKTTRLPVFGPYEDAMARSETQLFHTRVSALLNLHRLLPRTLVDDVTAMAIPLASQEGFVRQILGWREFMHHVHVETDGFRVLPTSNASTRAAGAQEALDQPGDGGYARWAKRAWPRSASTVGDGGASPSFLGARQPLPEAYWGTSSGLGCLDDVVADVWRDGYGHHITRLMVLSNLAALLDVSPRELTDWFWVAYADAYDWVVEPNVIAMGVFGVGDLATTKPYVAGAAYIDRMSDYCRFCQFDPQSTCPFTRLYWAYLARHRRRLDGNHRMLQVLRNFDARSTAERALDAATFDLVSDTLGRGEMLTEEALAPLARTRGPKSKSKPPRR